MKRNKQAAGFTLIELLVAVSLLALVSVLGYRGLDGMLRGRDGLDKRTQELAALNETWRWLARDLTHLIPALPATDGVPLMQTSNDDAGNTIVTMAVFNELRDAPDAEQARYRLVTYQIVASGLQRSERPLREATDATEIQTIILAPASRWKLACASGTGCSDQKVMRAVAVADVDAVAAAALVAEAGPCSLALPRRFVMGPLNVAVADSGSVAVLPGTDASKRPCSVASSGMSPPAPSMASAWYTLPPQRSSCKRRRCWTFSSSPRGDLKCGTTASALNLITRPLTKPMWACGS